MRMLEALRSFMFSKYRWLGFIGLFLLAIFVVPHYAYADYGVDTANTIVSYFVATLTTILSLVLAMIGNMILAIIEILLVPVLQYNEFASSKIIGIGWSLVRDVMNMFVVAILIVIAMYTILNMKKAAWEQNLKNLFFAVVLMNFSRTICGVLIDISQVVMLTFVNALLDIAAGNFAQMWGINKFGAFDDIAVSTLLNGDGQGTGITAATGLFMSTLAQIPLYLVVFGVLLAMAVAFLYRIVALWILTIMSPMAFFMGGIKDIMPGIASGEKQWWTKFNAALLMGPILAFFLWLALSVSSSGNLLTNEGFKLPVISSAPRFIVDSLGSAQLGATLIAIVLLITGMGIAAEQAKSLGGLAASVITEGWAKKLAKVGAKGALRTGERMLTTPLAGVGWAAGAATALGAGGLGLTNVGRYADQFRQGSKNLTMGKSTLDGNAERLARAGAALGAGAVGAAAGYTGSEMLFKAQDKLQKFGDAKNDAELAAAKKQADAMTSEEFATRMEMYTAPGYQANTEADAHLRDAAMARFLSNKGARTAYLDARVAGGANRGAVESATYGAALRQVRAQNAAKSLLDQDKLNDITSGQLHNWTDAEGHLNTDEIRTFVSSKDFNRNKLVQASVNNGAILGILDDIQDHTRRDDATFGASVREGKIAGVVGPVQATQQRNIATAATNTRNVLTTGIPAVAATGAAPAVPAGPSMRDILTGAGPTRAADFDAAMTNISANLTTHPEIQQQINMGDIVTAGVPAAERPALLQGLHTESMNWLNAGGHTAEQVRAVVNANAVQPNLFQDTDFTSASGGAAAWALASQGINPATYFNDANGAARPAVAAAYQTALEGYVGSDIANPAVATARSSASALASGQEGRGLAALADPQFAQVRAALLNRNTQNEVPTTEYLTALNNTWADAQRRGMDLPAMFNGAINIANPTAANLGAHRRDVGVLLRANPSNARALATAVSAAPPVNGANANDVTQALVRSVTAQAATNLARTMNNRSSTPAQRREARESLEVVQRAAAIEAAQLLTRTEGERDRAGSLNDHIETLLTTRPNN